MAKQLNIALIFGGKSGEHEVSIQSARSIYQALDKTKYNVTLVGIDKQGGWNLISSSAHFLYGPQHKLLTNKALNGTVATKSAITSIHPNLQKIDVAFPIIHGTYGEDGSLQGLLEMMDVTYVGAGVLGSAVGMDKEIMKRLLREAKIPVAEFVTVSKSQASRTVLLKKLQWVAKKLKYPIFVKPANMGSSVGISKANNFHELQRAVNKALQYDTKILLEKAVKGREIECSVLGNEHPIASVPGEVIPTHEFYSYEAKYLDENGAALEIPAKLSKVQAKQIQNLAIRVFQTLQCAGMGRVDFFLTPKGKIIVNEINTLPGFTSISMYPKLWEASGLPYPKLLDRLIQLALERKKNERKLKRSNTLTKGE